MSPSKLMMRRVGFEPTKLAPTDLKPVALTTRPSSLLTGFIGNKHYLFVLLEEPLEFGATRI
jgi:hypothetical protein